MRRIVGSFMFSICFGVTVCSAQEPAPKLLIYAAHCLDAKHFLTRSNDEHFSLGYILDKDSYPGKNMLYVVAFSGSQASNGDVFTIFLTTNSGRNDFNIQNTASFIISKNEPFGVSFVDPPLGGSWTQEHIASAIQAIVKQPRYIISAKDVLTRIDSTCESYTDNQPKDSVDSQSPPARFAGGG